MNFALSRVIPRLLVGACLVIPATAQTVPNGAQAAIPPGQAPKLDSKVFDQETLAAPASSFEEAIDRAIQREHILVQKLKSKAPVVETYIQEVKPDEDLGTVPHGDRYFLGKLDLHKGVDDASFIPLPSGWRSMPQKVEHLWTMEFSPQSFAYMMWVDEGGFDRSHYDFNYVRREFLGDVRCLVVDVKPKEGEKRDRFLGRIWIEDEGYNVVRFNGVYVPVKDHNHSHFDSWRVNAGPGLWLPAYIYFQESSHGHAPLKSPGFRAQTRLWNYEEQRERSEEAFTSIQVEGVKDEVKDQSATAANDNSPVEEQRLWERQAEDNVIDRLQQAGLVAPKGEVDQVLETVLNNIMVTNNLNPEPGVRVRVLLTTPLESAPVGHTILISRGLIDVLPDEASLAAVVAHELAHIMLDHSVNTAYAFTDRLLFDDPDVLKHVNVARTKNEEEAADSKALEYLKKSPYADKLPRVGLFLRQLSQRSDEVPHLIKPLLGNKMADTKKDLRMAPLTDMAPELQVRNVDQIAALPLGSRIRMNPWNDNLYLMKTHNVPLMSAKEKLPFEVTPFMLHLTREPGAGVPAPTNNTVPTSSNGTVSTSQVTAPAATQQ